MSKLDDQKLREIQAILQRGEEMLARRHPLTGTPFKKMLLDTVPEMEEALSELALRASDLTRYNDEVVCLACLDPDTLFKTVLHAVFNLEYDEGKDVWEIKRNSMYFQIGWAITDMYVASLADNAQKLYDNLQQHCVDKGLNSRQTKRILDSMKKLLDLDPLRLGGLVHDVLEPFLLQLLDCYRGKLSAYTYQLKADVAEQMWPLIQSHILSSKSLGFMVTPPKELTPETLYRTQRYVLDRPVSATPFISKPSETAIRAANKLQATPFGVDERVLAVLLQLSDDEMADIACEGKQVSPTERARKLQEFKSVLNSAETIAEVGPVYFPVFFDFRGRMYYEADTASVLSPQSAKWARGLLRFHNGIPAGLAGWDKIFNEYANAQGNDKVALSKRSDMGFREAAKFFAISESPLRREIKDIWMQADEPIKALSMALEIADIWKKSSTSWENALNYVSHAILHFDGTCNGIQHLAMLSKSTEMARAVNIIGDITTRRDIYQQVADKAIEMSEGTAQQILREHGRKLCKQPTMTVPYGAKRQDRQVLSTLNELRVPDADALTPCVTKAIKKAITEVLVGLNELDAALRDFAKSCVDMNLDPTWTTPAGFVVTQQYREAVFKTRKVYGNKKAKLPDGNQDGPILGSKNLSGIRPNVIHSLDACHLQLTVDAADFDLVTIHDSFGVHAGSAMQLQHILGQTLESMYEGDFLAEVTGVPAQGDLNLAEHHISPHAFS